MKKILLLAGAMTTAAITAGAELPKGVRVGVNLNTIYGASSTAVPKNKFNGSRLNTGGDVSKSSFNYNQRPVLGLGVTAGYDLHRHFGLLFSYQYLGRRSVSGADGIPAAARGSLSTDSFSLTGEGRLPLVSSLDLTARLGLIMVSNRLSIRRGNITVGNTSIFSDADTHNVKEIQWGVNYGLGFQYHLNECTDIDVGLEAITPFSHRNIGGTYYTRFYVGASYKF